MNLKVLKMELETYTCGKSILKFYFLTGSCNQYTLTHVHIVVNVHSLIFSNKFKPVYVLYKFENHLSCRR